jgi:hypothetical protein
VITRKKVGVSSLTNNSLVWNISMPMSFCLEGKTGEVKGKVVPVVFQIKHYTRKKYGGRDV